MENNKKIAEELDYIFKDAPKTYRSKELKEEMVSNLNEKYIDLVSSGKSEEEALSTVINSIGDVDELISNLCANNKLDYAQNQKQKQKSAIAVSIAVMGYFIAVTGMILIQMLTTLDVLSIAWLLIFAGFSTCLLIYNAMTQPKYSKVDDTMVEEFKEWKNEKDKKSQVLKSLNSILWMTAVAIYFVVSFITGAWYITWIIYIMAVIAQQVLFLFFNVLKK